MRRRLSVILALLMLGVISFAGSAWAYGVECKAGKKPCSGDNKANSMFGSSGSDVMQGFGGADRMSGENGHDRMYGGDGSEGGGSEGSGGGGYMYGGHGHDTMKGGTGHDSMYGEEGHDKFYGASGDDTLDAGNGRDRIIGNTGNDNISTGYSDGEKDYVDCGQGNDTVSEAGYEDTLLNCEIKIYHVPHAPRPAIVRFAT
jgi:serralysin